MTITNILDQKFNQMQSQETLEQKRKAAFKENFKLHYKEAVESIANQIAMRVIRASSPRKQHLKYAFSHYVIEEGPPFVLYFLDQSKFKNTVFNINDKISKTFNNKFLLLRPKVVKSVNKILQSASTHEKFKLDYKITSKGVCMTVEFKLKEKNIFEMLL